MGRRWAPAAGGVRWALLASVCLATCGPPGMTALERDRAVERLLAASADASTNDKALLSVLRRLLPGEEIPKPLLGAPAADGTLPALERWTGQVGDWKVDALRTTNDSQAGCEPWGSITAVSLSARREHPEQASAQWQARLTAMLARPPAEAQAPSARWLMGKRSPWYASVSVVQPDRITLDLSCEDHFDARGR